jgi:hypothetical protein
MRATAGACASTLCPETQCSQAPPCQRVLEASVPLFHIQGDTDSLRQSERHSPTVPADYGMTGTPG